MRSLCAKTTLLLLVVVYGPKEVVNFDVSDDAEGRIQYLEDNTGEVFITVSATNKFKIELNWNLTKVTDQIRLYLQQPPYDNVKPNVMVQPYEKEGFYITNETFSTDSLPFRWKIDSPGLNLTKGPINLDYCITAVENNRITKTNCLKIEPTWMKNNGDVIGDIPLTGLMIPGTHNSGCYGDYPHLDIKDPVFKFIYTQDTDIWTQLVFGIRYLDVRVGYYNTTFVRDSFWVNHDKFKVNPLKELFRDLKKFLARAKDEIVILDLHRFPVGFKHPERHKQLIALIDTELGDIAIPRSYQKPPKGPTLKELWAQKGRLIICYGDTGTAFNSDYLWDPLTQKWGNKQKVEDLKQYLQEIRSNHDSKNNNKLWASMAELTPTPASILGGLLSFASSFRSVAHMSDNVNRNLNSWYRYSPCDVNIVATDFFLGNDLINIALECNLKRGRN